MELPIDLKISIENRCSSCKQAALISAAQALSDRYRKETGKGKRLLTKDIEALAYAAVRMPATYGAVYSALQHTFECFHDPLESVLDVGAGTGSAVWAISELLNSPLTVTCLEREPAMISLGSGLMASNPVLCQAKWIHHDMALSQVSQHADIVIASYALNEMDDEIRRAVVSNLWDCAEKLLLIVEPGTPAGFRQLLRARTELIRRGGHIVAPCPHISECPLEENDWCHFTCRVSRSRLHKTIKGGDVPYEDEKYSFLAISKTPVQPAFARVLRHPLKEDGRITLRLCTQSGVATKTVSKKQGELFKKARKANSGDVFPEIKLKGE